MVWALYFIYKIMGGMGTWEGDATSENGDGVYGTIIWIGSSNEGIHLASCNILYLNHHEIAYQPWKFCIDSPDAEQLT